MLFELGFCFIYHIYFLWLQMLLIMRRCRILNTSPYLLPTRFQLNYQQNHVFALTSMTLLYDTQPYPFFVYYIYIFKIFTFALESRPFEVISQANELHL